MSDIDAKYAQLGGSAGFLGAPKGNETVCPDGTGHFRHYTFGSIYWSPTSGAHEVHGAVQDRWAQGGWERGLLGYPLTDAIATPDQAGRFNHFQHGSIYWKSNIGAHEVHGLIRQHWAQQGWERNPSLGYPISDETPAAPGSGDRYSDFENGVVFWKSGAARAFELAKSTLQGSSRAFVEVAGDISAMIVPLLSKPVDGRQLYITNGPAFCGPEPIGSPAFDLPTFIRPVTEYWLNGAAVRNRMYKTRTEFGITVDGSADIRVVLDLWIEVFLDKAQHGVFAAVRFAWISTHVPWPTSMGTSADEVNVKLKAALTPVMNNPHKVGSVPPGVNVVSAKVMPNGDLNVYIVPLL